MEDFSLECSNLGDPKQVKLFASLVKLGMEKVLKKKLTTEEARAALLRCLLPPHNENFSFKELVSLKYIFNNNLI